MSPRKSDKRSADGDPHRTREQAKYDKPIASREFITSVLSHEKGPMNFEALADALGLTGNEQDMEALRRRVGAMIRDGQLIQNRRRGLVPVDTDALIAGRISAHPDGFGFVIADDGDKDIYLNGKQMRQVLHGDRVVVCITGIDHRGRREGRIVDVVERANKSLVGRISIDRGTAVVLPDNKRIHQNLLIASGELGDAADGDMVVAEIVDQPTRRHQPVGRVVEVLGQHLRPGMEIDVALHSHGIPSEWPQEVIEQAAAFSTTVSEDSVADRKDVRAMPLITIDGIDARDFDDAVWCERLESGWRLMVAIADVANYVSPNSPLDKEAVERGTSVYFPGRVVPMLPEVLSNGLCSLNPNVDRLCMICEMTLDSSGKVKKTRFHNGIMRSHARLTYDQVSEMLTDADSALRNEHAVLVPMIEELHALYKALSKRRRKRGAIEFDSNETHIVFDENKKISEIVPIERNDAHKLIEECMILANIQAAAFLEEREIPALYRIHAGPKTDRLIDLREFLSLRGLSLGGGDKPTALDYAALAEQIADRTDRSVIQTVMLRSMQQAVYQPKNEGHFGLALDQYAHFTSPIRRYPDLLVHRAIKHALKHGKASGFRYSTEAMQVLGESCSMTERRAEEASRDVIAWLKCEYMQEHVGGEFPGVVSAVTSFGLFVELVGIHVEGLVHITNLSHDYYRFEQAAHTLTGERTGRQYLLGDAIVVKVAAVNLEDRKIDFLEVEHRGVGKKRKHSQSGDAAPVKARSDKYSKKPGSKSRRKEKVPVVSGASPVPAVAPQQPAASGVAAKQGTVSAEQRRREKRRIKQRRRDNKRAALREAKKLEAIRLAGNTPTVADSTSKPSAPVASKKSSRRRGKKRPVQLSMVLDVDNSIAATTPETASEPVLAEAKRRRKVVVEAGEKETSQVSRKIASSAEAASEVSDAQGSASSKVASEVTRTSIDKTAEVVAKKATSKKAAGKAAGKKAASKATSKKVASKAVSKATSKKVASKAVSKATSKKVASKAVGKATSKKVAGKSAGKLSAKKTTSQADSATRKKTAFGVGSKATGKKVSKAVTKKKAKAASKAAGKTASKVKAKVRSKRTGGKAD